MATEIPLNPELAEKLIRQVLCLPASPVGPHLDDADFVDYEGGLFSASEQLRIDDHLASCADCSTKMLNFYDVMTDWEGPEGEQRIGLLRQRLLTHQETAGMSAPADVSAPAEIHTSLPRESTVITPASPWVAGLRSFWLPRLERSWGLVATGAVLGLSITGLVLIGFNTQLAQNKVEIATLRRHIEMLDATAALRPSVPATATRAAPDIRAQVRTDLERELPSMIAATVSKIPPPLSILLAPGAQRGAGQTRQSIVVPRDRDALEFILTLTDSGAYASYSVVIQTIDTGRQIWGRQVALSEGLGANSLRFTVPSRTLREGDYRLLISGRRPDRPPEPLKDYYVFHVDIAPR